MGKKKGKKKWNAHYDKHLGENSNDKGMALKHLDVIGVKEQIVIANIYDQSAKTKKDY